MIRLGLAGWSGSGKTTLVERLVPALIARGLQVSTIKHAHHAFEIDQPGKDSHRHRLAGATEVMVGSALRWAVIRELRGAPEPTLDQMVARLALVDLVLIEGFKQGDHDKIEVFRAALQKPPLHPDDPGIIAVASDRPIPGLALPRLALDDAEAIAGFIIDRYRLKGTG